MNVVIPFRPHLIDMNGTEHDTTLDFVRDTARQLAEEDFTRMISQTDRLLQLPET